jgi:hypothetical protein
MLMRYAVPLVLLLAVPAAAEEARDLTYVCVEEHAAGLRFDAAARRWESTRFAPARQFTLTMKHEGALHRLSDSGRREEVPQYSVSITRSGSDTAIACHDLNRRHALITLFEQYFQCRFELIEYRFDLSTKRYVSAYLHGYLGGDKDVVDQPRITAGSCAKREPRAE